MQVSTSPRPSLDPRLADDAAARFRLLGDPTRLRLVHALGHHDEMCVHELAAQVGASETKVSQALRLLRVAGTVRARRDGRHVHYRLDDDCVRTLIVVATAADGVGGDD